MHRGAKPRCLPGLWLADRLWPERTRALEFADAVLHVEVPDAGWKREMQNLAPRYLAQLNRYAGQKVERIEFVIRLG